MAGDIIGYKYPVIDQETENMLGVNRQIEGLIEGLGSGIGQALDSWTGAAASEYNTKAAEISTQLNQMNSIVVSLATTLKELAAEMEAQDGRSGGQIAYG